VNERHGPSTRAVHAGLPPAAQGEPFLPGPVLASAFHLVGDVDAAPYGYHREGSPTCEAYEAALGELEGGEAVLFASGMAAAAAVLLCETRPGDVLVAPADGYPGVRSVTEHLAARGVDVRLVPSRDEEVLAALPGASLVWIETPSNPGLAVLDVARVAEAAHATAARLVVDNTLATPLLQRPLDEGADVSMSSDSKYMTGHSDLVLGHVAARDRDLVARLRHWRTVSGAIAGPFETWLAHRSLATLGVRLQRQCANAAALAQALGSRDDVRAVRYPGIGGVLSFELPEAAAAQRFLSACRLVNEATSFGGVHSTAERRARWGGDAVPEGFIRFSAGVEDCDDLVADVMQALDAG
jgi:cystathionine gamma-lyase